MLYIVFADFGTIYDMKPNYTTVNHEYVQKSLKLLPYGILSANNCRVQYW